MFPVIECISANSTFYKAKVAKDSALRRGNGAFVTPVAAGSHVTRSSKPSGRPPQGCSSTPQSVATTNLFLTTFQAFSVTPFCFSAIAMASAYYEFYRGSSYVPLFYLRTDL